MRIISQEPSRCDERARTPRRHNVYAGWYCACTAVERSRHIQLSQFLSKHLRHQPERLGLTLAPGGWVEVDALLTAMAAHGFTVTRAELEQVVSHNDKQRFSFSEDGRRIRANQGHSVAVDLQLEARTPPVTLYHGTSEQAVAAIQAAGLSKMARHHVHLSTNLATAIRVGRRHGRPVVFAVDAAAMHRDGYHFFCSDNGVWLVEHVPPPYLRLMSADPVER